MCLNRLEKITNSTNLKNGIGYKVFCMNNTGRYVGSFQNYNQVRAINRWLNEKDFRLYPYGTKLTILKGVTYTIGWHIYLNKKDAIKSNGWGSRVVKVKFKDVVATGYEGGNSLVGVVVAQQILILPKQGEE